VTFILDEEHWEMLLAIKGRLPQFEKFDVDVLGDPSDDSDILLDIFEVAPKLHIMTTQYRIEALE
jgi:hypothetical protein